MTGFMFLFPFKTHSGGANSSEPIDNYKQIVTFFLAESSLLVFLPMSHGAIAGTNPGCTGTQLSSSSNAQRKYLQTDPPRAAARLYAAIMVKPLLALLAIFAFVAAAALVSRRIKYETGLHQLERSSAAIREAKSWTVKSVAARPDANFLSYEATEKVCCPYDKEFSSWGKERNGNIFAQDTILMQDSYYLQIGYGPWQKYPQSESAKAIQDCGIGPYGQDILQVGELKLRGQVEKGERQFVGGVPCQEWKIDFGYKWPPMQPYSVCLDPKTNLPLQITYTETNATTKFTGWNETKVVPPQL